MNQDCWTETLFWRKRQLPSMQGHLQCRVLLGHKRLQVQRQRHQVLADLEARRVSTAVLPNKKDANYPSFVSLRIIFVLRSD